MKAQDEIAGIGEDNIWRFFNANEEARWIEEVYEHARAVEHDEQHKFA